MPDIYGYDQLIEDGVCKEITIEAGPGAVLRPRVCFCKSELCNGHDFKELKKPQELEKCNSSPLSLDQTSKYYYQSLTILLYNIICNLPKYFH